MGSAPGAGPFPSALAAAILAGMAGGFTNQQFVGRAAELQRLAAALERAEQGRPQLVLLAGEAGVGKTRLLLEFAERVRQRGVRVLAGGCVELGEIGLGYLPVVDALRGLADDPAEVELLTEVATTAPGLGRLLPGVARPALSATPDDGVDQLQVFDAVRVLLMRRSQQSPVVVVLEDLHWADRSTRDLVAFLARTMWSGRVTLVASYRSDELHRRHPLRPLLAELVRLPGVERLELAPFSRAELAKHLEAITGTPLPPDRVERIYERSEGNPFYAEQLLAAGADRAKIALPATLADVLLARVQALSEPAQRMLGVVAVAGRRVPHRLLAQVAGWPEAELEQALREAIGAGVLIVDARTGTFGFRHALLQEAVYADLLPGEQVRLHAAYAHLLAAGPQGAAAELAYHCLRSHDLVGALAASVRAADEAAAVLAPAETLHHLTSALKLWARVPDAAGVTGTDQVKLTLRAAAAAYAAGDLPRAVALAQHAAAMAEQTTDAAWAARAHERLGLYLQHVGRDEDALRACARAVELVPAAPPSRLRARVTAAMAQWLMNNGRADEARRWCEEALAVARAIASAEDEADALITLATVEQRLDNADVGISLLHEARAKATTACDHLLELRAQHALGVLELDRGDLGAGAAAFEEAIVLAEATGLTWSGDGVQARLLRCYAYYQAGMWDQAEQVSADLDERSPAAAELSAVALFVEVGRGRPGVAGRLARIKELHGNREEWAAYLDD